MFVLIKNCTPTHVLRSVVTGPNNYSRKGRKEAANRNRKEAKEKRIRPSLRFADRKNTAGRNGEKKRNETKRVDAFFGR